MNNFFIFTHCISILGCNPNPCQNGGTCINGGCKCPPNTVGPRCEYKIGSYEIYYIILHHVILKFISLGSRIS